MFSIAFFAATNINTIPSQNPAKSQNPSRFIAQKIAMIAHATNSGTLRKITIPNAAVACRRDGFSVFRPDLRHLGPDPEITRSGVSTESVPKAAPHSTQLAASTGFGARQTGQGFIGSSVVSICALSF